MFASLKPITLARVKSLVKQQISLSSPRAFAFFPTPYPAQQVTQKAHLFSTIPETSVLSTPEVASLPATSEVETKPSKLERRSSFNGDVRGASNLDSRIQSTLQTIREKIPEAVDSVEDDIAVANRDRVILALANFLGSK